LRENSLGAYRFRYGSFCRADS